MLVIQGPAGIGKSALVRVLGEHATGQGVQTLSARASELERDFGFGVVRQLLETRVIRGGGSERAEWHQPLPRYVGRPMSHPAVARTVRA